MIKQAVVVFLLFPSVALALSINEVSPRGTEWIEIYNPDGAINITDLRVSDNSENQPDSIECADCIVSDTFFLILGKDTTISQITSDNVRYFYVDDGLIGNGLRDTTPGDFVKITNGSFVSQLSFSSSSLDKTWCSMPDGAPTIQECSPTPGKANFNQETTTSSSASSTTSTVPSAQESAGSSIKITKTSKPRLNEPLEVSLTIQKGDTQKYAVYVWVDESRKSVIHVKETGTFDFQIPVYVKEPCREHALVVEGLDLREEVPLERAACSSGGVQIKVIDIPEEINANDSLDLKISLLNEDGSEKNIDLSSYFYFGNEIASFGFDGSAWEGGPSANRISLVLAPQDIINVTLKNKLKENAKGKYYLKIKAQDGSKEYQYEKEVYVGKKKVEQKTEEKPNKETKDPLPTGLAIRKPSFFQKLFAPLTRLVDGIKGLF